MSINQLINCPSLIIILILISTLINNNILIKSQPLDSVQTSLPSLSQLLLMNESSSELLEQLISENNGSLVSNITWNELSSSLINQQLNQLARERKRRERISFIRANVLNHLESNESINTLLTNYTNYGKNNATDYNLINGLIINYFSSTPTYDEENDTTTAHETESSSAATNEIKENIFPNCSNSNRLNGGKNSGLGHQSKTRWLFHLPPPPSKQVMSTTTAKLFMNKFNSVNLQSVESIPSHISTDGHHHGDLGLTMSVYKLNSLSARGKNFYCP